MPERARYFEGKKYFWDGAEYESDEEVRAKEKEYSDGGFEVRVYREDGPLLLYTRRVVKEVVVDES